jgi:hypothetical protein
LSIPVAIASLALAAVVVHSATAQDLDGPSLALDPDTGPPGSLVEASGSGFAASPCGVNLFLDSPTGPLLGFVVIPEGSDAFSTNLEIPADTTIGEHLVIAQGLLFGGPAIVSAASIASDLCGDPSGEEASAGFEVTTSKFLIRFKTRAFVPEPGLNLDAIREQRAGEPGDRVHFLLQFEELPDAATKENLASQGLGLGTFVTGNTYIASTLVGDLENLLEIPGLRWAGPLEIADKIDPELQNANGGGLEAARAQLASDVVLTIQFHRGVDPAEAEALVEELGGEIITFEDLPATVPSIPSVTAFFASIDIETIAAQDSVQYVDVVEEALTPTNDGARAAANVDPLAAAPFNLTGAGVTALVYDVGQADATHPDFGARIIENDGSRVADHATHVAGSVAGSGANSNGNDSAGNPNGGTPNQWAGMAPGANLRSFGTTGGAAAFYDGGGGDLNADFTTAIGNGIDLATMSLGNNAVLFTPPRCAQLGDYTNTAILIDNIVTGSIAGQQLIYFESAGNERQNPPGPPPAAPCGQFGTIGSPATAKNSIAVGAINSNDNSLTGFTSLGPTDDGRLKPDITAPGCQNGGDLGLTSPSFVDADNDGFFDVGETQNAYVVKCGTSMATPVSAGAAGLLIQQWRSTRGAGTRPLPHTMKAILVHTGNDLGNAGPDFQFGWGGLDAEAAADLVVADDTADLIHVDEVDQGAVDFYTFASGGAADVRVTLVWDDPAAARLAAVTLINDLDLRLVDVAAPGNDATNNVEMVVGLAKAGAWTVRVVGTNVPQGPQQYTLITPEGATLRTLDHYRGYRVVRRTRTRPQFPVLTLTDQFESALFEVGKPTKLFNPANKNDEGILDRETHLVGHRIRRAEPGEHEPRSVDVINQFGRLRVTTVDPELLLIPSLKNPTPGTPLPTFRVDHFKCYLVRHHRFTPSVVTVEDQFMEREFEVRKPVWLCAPVDKAGEGIRNPDDHLLCYIVAPLERLSFGVSVDNQLGPEQLEVVREGELCVPSTKEEL